MDAVSFSIADKQAKRIGKIINDPDSTSGVVTVPSTIAAGETITIPAGRTAILPNIQVDGTLNVDGTVFIPTGSSTSQVIPRVASTDNAIVRFNGTTGDIQNSTVIVDDNGWLNFTAAGARITGDFSNASFPSRVSFQTSTLNDPTTLTIIPNGAAQLAQIQAYSNSSTNNCSRANIGVNSSTGLVHITSDIVGSGTYFPMTFSTGGSERMRIDTSGNVLLTSGTGGLGYGTGSGGTVTQATSKSTTVTLNKPTGQIIMNNAALAAGARIEFTCNNNLVTINDTVVINVNTTNNGYRYKAEAHPANGQIYIYVTNIDTISQSDAVQLNFTIIKGAIS